MIMLCIDEVTLLLAHWIWRQPYSPRTDIGKTDHESGSVACRWADATDKATILVATLA
jgi:hypothetical protein